MPTEVMLDWCGVKGNLKCRKKSFTTSDMFYVLSQILMRSSCDVRSRRCLKSSEHIILNVSPFVEKKRKKDKKKKEKVNPLILKHVTNINQFSFASSQNMNRNSIQHS